MVFLITGLQARTLIARIGDYSMSELAISAAVVSAVVITARFVWMYPATYLPRWLFPPLKRRDPSPSWRWPFLLAFTGVRGIVSLAAALAIPLATVNGQPFPYRDLILFLTFVVILVTLVGQGLMLPWVIRALGLATTGRRERDTERAEEHTARRQAIEAAIARLDQLAAERTLSEEIVQPIRSNHYDRLKHIKNRGDSDESHRRHIELRDEIELLLLAVERQKINELYRSGRLKDETRRRIERELDVREAHLANKRSEE
jgi:NhaP-type Na+/H+ and K+/H+ antiporter